LLAKSLEILEFKSNLLTLVQNQDLFFCYRGASIPKRWFRGLHHCTFA